MIEKKINLHFRRFEFKYFLDKTMADRMIPELLNYMEWDPFVGDKEYYECHSLYFDNQNLKCYHEKIDGILNRKKVRIRSYRRDFSESDSLFFEIKRKSGEVVLKDREIFSGKSLDAFIENPFVLLKEKEGDSSFLNELIFETTHHQMKPTCLVSYKRKPFFDKLDPEFRITFDFDLEFAKPNGASFDQPYQAMEDEFVVMEVKFNGSLPKWFHRFMERFRLQKTESCKYCFGIDTLYGEPYYS